MLTHLITFRRYRMNWLPVLSAIAIVAAGYLGIDNPGRAIIIQLCIAFVTLLAMGISFWKETRLTARSI